MNLCVTRAWKPSTRMNEKRSRPKEHTLGSFSPWSKHDNGTTKPEKIGLKHDEC